MKRWLIHLTIFSYLGCLAWGIFAHGTQTRQNSSPAMYFVVWDMFCGWNAYSARHHVIAEGESGKYYELTPSPWGEFHPFGYEARVHYDPSGLFTPQMGLNTLKRTKHEPMRRILVIEENWPKKFNMSESYWATKYDEPKDEFRYCHVWQVLDGEGRVLQNSARWMSQQSQLAILNNPQLRRDSVRNRPFVAVQSQRATKSSRYPSPSFFPQNQVPHSTVNGN